MQLLILLVCFAAPCLSGRVRFSDDSDRRDVPSQYYQQQDLTRYNADYPRYVQGGNGYSQQGANGYNQQDRDNYGYGGGHYSHSYDQVISQGANGYDQQGVNGYNQQDRDSYSYGGGHYSQYDQGANGYNQQDRDNYNGNSQYTQENKFNNRMTDAQIAKVLELVNSVSDQVNRAYLRENDPSMPPPSIEIEGIKGTPKEVKVQLEGDISKVLQEGSALPAAIGASLLRQGTNTAGEQTLGSMGETIVLPGSGPTIDLQVEGDLAEKMKKMTLAQITMAPDTDSQKLMGIPYGFGLGR